MSGVRPFASLASISAQLANKHSVRNGSRSRTALSNAEWLRPMATSAICCPNGGQIKNLRVTRDDRASEGVASGFGPGRLPVREVTAILEDRAGKRSSKQRLFFYRKHCVRGDAQ